MSEGAEGGARGGGIGRCGAEEGVQRRVGHEAGEQAADEGVTSAQGVDDGCGWRGSVHHLLAPEPDSPAGALDQIALLALTSGVDLGWDKVQTYVTRVIDVVVQLDRTAGARRLSEVLFRPGRQNH